MNDKVKQNNHYCSGFYNIIKLPYAIILNLLRTFKWLRFSKAIFKIFVNVIFFAGRSGSFKNNEKFSGVRIVIIAFTLIALSTVPVFISGIDSRLCAATEDDKYDAVQWYQMARYHYQKRRNISAAQSAIFKACELDSENPEILAYLRYLAVKTKMNIPDKFQTKMTEYKGHSQAASRWFINGTEAFAREAYDHALHCFNMALQNDVADRDIASMINITKREILLLKIKEKLESSEDFAALLDKNKDAASGESVGTKEIVLSLKSAKDLIEQGKTFYDPTRFTEWFGFARYIFNVKKDYKNAKLAVDAALLYNASNEVALKLKHDIEKKINEIEEAEAKKAKELEEAIALEKQRKIDEEKKKRTLSVREVVINSEKNERNNKKSGQDSDFTMEEFLDDTAAVDLFEGTVEIKGKTKETFTAREIKLVNEPVTSDARKKQIDEMKQYVMKHSAMAKKKFSEGKLHESLLEYEKIYLKILDIDHNDVKSLYNLVLIYKKMGEQRNSQEYFMRLVVAVNETNARYSSSKQITRIFNYVDCCIKSSIVNAAVLTYNKNSYYKMDRANFNLEKLYEKGYLRFNESDEQVVTLSLSSGYGGDERLKNVKFRVTGLKCNERGNYKIGIHKCVSCSIHGENPLILSAQELDTFE